MRSRTLTTSASALLLLAASVVNASHGVHEHLETLHKRHRVHREQTRSSPEIANEGVEIRSIAPESLVEKPQIRKRGGQCQFPYSDGLVPVTSGDENAGWAMSPNQPCLPGNYCPYACPAGQVSVQWDPAATSYSYPLSMNGGLYCDENGNINKPFPDKPYCEATTAVIGVQNNAGAVVAFCQTVLPGNEAMLIPTAVESWTQLAIPDTSYWCETAAHYYINPPGTTTDVACVWGTNQNPWGNWAPYVAGGNTDANGNTFIKLGWNPIWLEPATPFRNEMPTWGVEIICNGAGCNGLPCAIDPTQNGVNEMVGAATDGAGGAAFCVVTVPQGVTANFVVSYANGAGSSSSSPSASWSSSATTTINSPSTTAWSSGSSSAEWAAPSFTQAQGKAGGFYEGGSTISAANSTTTMTAYSNSSHTYAPTHSPYYSLFNATGPTSAATTATTVGSTGPATAAATTASTGGAAALGMSGFGLALGVFAGLAVLCV